jgi:predicted nuclease of predicted toxin-antitoxin system
MRFLVDAQLPAALARWIRIGNTRTKPLPEWFEQGFEDLCSALARGEVLAELV